VKIVCTTDDPVDTLEWHQRLRANNDSGAAILPAWRPDKALNPDAKGFVPWLLQLENAVGFAIGDFEAFRRALTLRLEFFHANGCRLSDHALDTVPVGTPDDGMAQEAFLAAKRGDPLLSHLTDAYRVTLLAFLSGEYSRMGWTMQWHIGAMRNTNPPMFERLGPDTGFDAISDMPVARPVTALLGACAARAPLPRTLLFTLNDKDNYTLAALAGTLQQDGACAHVSQGPAWWFHDQRDGMEKQMRSLANVGVLSEFIGMTTDSRSLLSYTRHEYFRRIFCNLLGNWVENGEYPEDYRALEMIIRKVCFENAMALFRGVSGS
jgi:glucuronate isomerase